MCESNQACTHHHFQISNKNTYIFCGGDESELWTLWGYQCGTILQKDTATGTTPKHLLSNTSSSFLMKDLLKKSFHECHYIESLNAPLKNLVSPVMKSLSSISGKRKHTIVKNLLRQHSTFYKKIILWVQKLWRNAAWKTTPLQTFSWWCWRNEVFWGFWEHCPGCWKVFVFSRMRQSLLIISDGLMVSLNLRSYIGSKNSHCS